MDLHPVRQHGGYQKYFYQQSFRCRCGQDHGNKKGLAVTVDCNGKYVYADPFKGTMMAVSEAARNIVLCSGGEPAAITNCLNFGNPYNPEVYWQFVQAIKGMGEACKAF